MGEQELYCTPGPNSRHQIIVSPAEKHQKLYLSAFYPKKDGTDTEEVLQCWTNLPILNKEDDSEWVAIDVTPWHPRPDGQFASRLIIIDTDALLRRLYEDRESIYALTWRVVKRKDDHEAIQWLYNPDQNATISFHLPSSDNTSRRLIETLDLVEHTVVEESGSDLILSAQLDLNSSTTKLLSCRQSIPGGATWERTKSTWHTSRSLSHFHDISDSYRASLVTLVFADLARIVIVLPVCRQSSTVNIIRVEDNLVAKCEGSGDSWHGRGHVLIALGPIKHLHALVSRCLQISTPKEGEATFNRHDSSPLLGNENFGFCSWEALDAGRERPTLSKMTTLLQKMEKRAPGAITSVIIDDGWQTVSEVEGHRRLTNFDLDSALLDNTKVDGNSILGRYIGNLKRVFPSIRYYGVWMTLAGYWDGLDKESFAEHYGPLSEMSCNGPFSGGQVRVWYMPDLSRLDAFYDDYFAFLKKAGIAFVKVDDQADWEWVQNKSIKSQSDMDINPIAYYDRAWHAMSQAAKNYFGSLCVINCMAFGHRCITGHILPSNDSHIFRNSDDTFPKVPEAHVWHIYHNAMNACLTGAIPNLIPDADMITTYMPAKDHQEQDWADFHAAFRACFSISTIWISDCAGLETDAGNDVLERLLAPAKDPTSLTTLGRLQTVQVGKQGSACCSQPLIKSVFDDLTSNSIGSALKMSYAWSTNEGTVAYAILSAWNVRFAASSVDWITSADVAESIAYVKSDDSYFFIYNHSSHSISLFSLVNIPSSRSALTDLPLLPLALEISQYRIYSITSALASRGHDKLQLACIGLVDKYAGLTAVLGSTVTMNNAIISSTLSRAGKCGFTLCGATFDEVKRWHACIDKVKVHQKNTYIEQIDDCVLIIVDMISHLQGGNSSKGSDLGWRIDLYEGE